jgi:5-methylcytosine-specific restriction endonuclease McrA
MTRRCLGCHTLISSGSYCLACRNTTRRGYGHQHQQRARKAIAQHPWCSRCGATDDLTADHTIPISQGGTDSPLTVLCRSCNSSRGDRDQTAVF